MSTEIAIRTEGGLLTLSPEKLLDYYLPEAQSVPGRVGTFEAPHPTKANEKIYVQEAVLVGMLHEAKQRHLNPVSEMYLIPSNAVNKKASWKLKYTAQLDQLRKLPGFLALHSGVIVERKGEWMDLAGTLLRPGDRLMGAWAEADFASHHRPIRHEVALERVKGLSPLWQSKPEFMLLKVVTDELIRLKIAPQFGLTGPKDPDFQEVGEEVVLEADEDTFEAEVLPPEEEPERTQIPVNLDRTPKQLFTAASRLDPPLSQADFRQYLLLYAGLNSTKDLTPAQFDGLLVDIQRGIASSWSDTLREHHYTVPALRTYLAARFETGENLCDLTDEQRDTLGEELEMGVIKEYLDALGSK